MDSYKNLSSCAMTNGNSNKHNTYFNFSKNKYFHYKIRINATEVRAQINSVILQLE